MDGLTIREASATLGISATTVRRRIKAGALPAREVPTTQGYEWRVFLTGEQVTTAGGQVATADGAAGGQLPTAGEPLATTSARGDDGQPGAWAPLEGQHRITPEAIERAVERTGSKYVADVQALFDRVGALYEAQLAAKDQTLAAQAGQLAAQAETLDALRRRAEAAEAERDALRATIATACEDAPQEPQARLGATIGADREGGVQPTAWHRLLRWLTGTPGAA